MPIVALTGRVDGITIRVSADGRTRAEALAAARRLLTRREWQLTEWLVSEQIDAEAHQASLALADSTKEGDDAPAPMDGDRCRAR